MACRPYATMSRRKKIWLASALAVILILAAFYVYYLQRSIGRAYVPPENVASGWKDDGDDQMTKAGGLAKLYVHDYKAKEFGSVILVVATPIPFVDFRGQVDRQVDKTLAEYDATATLAGSGQLSLAGITASYDEFIVASNGGTWNGKLLRTTFKCPSTGDSVAAVGFGVTDNRGLVKPQYDQAKEMIEAMKCR